MATAYLAFGSNLNNRRKLIETAVKQLTLKGIFVIKMSSLIETDPVGGPAQGKYLNAVAETQTELSPTELLKTILRIEKELGRERTIKNGPRTIDIDILLYNNIQLSTDDLIIPHPRMLTRDFVMDPLLEIAPEVHKELLNENYFKN